MCQVCLCTCDHEVNCSCNCDDCLERKRPDPANEEKYEFQHLRPEMCICDDCSVARMEPPDNGKQCSCCTCEVDLDMKCESCQEAEEIIPAISALRVDVEILKEMCKNDLSEKLYEKTQPKATCTNCYYYDYNMGKCRRYPPDFSLEFPTMSSGSWCGEHEWRE